VPGNDNGTSVFVSISLFLVKNLHLTALLPQTTSYKKVALWCVVCGGPKMNPVHPMQPICPTAQLTDKNVPQIDTDYTDDFKTVRSNEKTAALNGFFC